MDGVPVLTRRPLVFEAVELTSDAVRTGGVSGPLHLRWKLSVVVRCDDAVIRTVSIEDRGGVRRFGRGWARERGHRLDWWHYLPERLEPAVAQDDVCSTGEVITLVTWPGTTLRLLAVCAVDTCATSSRWRLRDQFHTGLSADLRFLAAGRRHGRIALADSC